MEKKNTILLTVIAVATLLVAVVGATFAYFTASTAGSGTGTATTGTATTIGSVAMDLKTIANSQNMSYPGGMLLNGASVTATVTGEGTFDASYTVNATVDASALTSTNTTLEVSLYKTTDAIDSAQVTGCSMQTGSAEDDVTYYYTGCAVPEGITGGDEVDSETITISSGTKTASLSFDDSTTFSGITSASPKTAYYYLVVEYVNNDAAAQNEDMGKAVIATITGITNAASTARAAS